MTVFRETRDFKNLMREYMSERFYVEGEDKDYYFGECPLNEYLTVFYNPEICKCNEIVSGLKSAHVRDIAQFETRRIRYADYQSVLDLSSSAFRIAGGTFRLDVSVDGDTGSERAHFRYVNVLPKGALEDRIKNEPERWALYEKWREKQKDDDLS